MATASKAAPTLDTGITQARESPASPRVPSRKLPRNQVLLGLQRKCSCDGAGSCESCNPAANPEIQRKVPIGPRDDAFEREADATADRIMRMSAPGTPRLAGTPAQVQRAGGEEKEEEIEQGQVQREAAGSATPAASFSASNLTRGGKALPRPVKDFFEPRFGRDFSSVKIHTGEDAERANLDLRSHAFTYGRHIWLGQGQELGHNALLAHELAHVVQQTEPPPLELSRKLWRAPDSESAPNVSDAPAPASTVEAMAESRGETLPPSQARRFETALDAPLSDVQVHTDAAAGRAAQTVGARAVATGRDIFFASGEYAPGTPAGDNLLAHELTHVIRDREASPSGPLRVSQPTDPDERAAKHAENVPIPSVVNSLSPAGHGARDSSKAVPLTSAPTGTLHRDLKDSIQQHESIASDSRNSEDDRFAAVQWLVKAGNSAAREALTRLAKSADQLVVNATVRTIADNAHDSAALWDIVLSTASSNAWTAGASFVQWLRAGAGSRAIAYLEQKLLSKDVQVQRNASRVIVILLGFQNEPESRPFRAAFERLREMARKQGLNTGGILGVESLSARTFSLYYTLSSLGTEIFQLIEATDPSEDLHHNDDLSAIAALIEHFAAGQKELVAQGDIPESALPALDQKVAELTELLEALTVTVTRTRKLHENAGLLRTFLGKDVQSDEITALYEVRSLHVMALMAHPQAPPRPTRLRSASFGPEPGFRTLWGEAQISFDRYDMVVAGVKWARLRPRIADANSLFDQGFAVRPGGGAFYDLFYQSMRRDFEDRRAYLDQRYNPPMSGNLGGVKVVVRGVQPAPYSLEDAIQIEFDVALHGFDAALFAMYAMALRMSDVLVTFDIGDEDFRKSLLMELNGIRGRLENYWRNEKFKDFGDAAAGIQRQIKSIADRIEHQVHLDIAINLLITLAAALISGGIGAIARIALLGDVIAGVRTAESAATIVYLVEAGSFTAAQLSGEGLVRGKAPSIGQIATAAVENLAFFGAFRAVSRLTAGFAQGSKIAAFVALHAVGLSTLTVVSALLTKIETGSWPPDVATFLFQTAATYIIVASVHGLIQSKFTNPRMQAKMQAATKDLALLNEGALNDLRASLNAGTLTEPEFNRIRDEKIEIYNRLIEIVRFAKGEGMMSADDADAIEQFFDQRRTNDRAANFALLMHIATATGRTPAARALPEPQSLTGLVRVGDTSIYRYEPASPPPGLPGLIKSYEDAGFEVSGTVGDPIRITDSEHHTVLVFEPGSSAAPLPMLPAGGAGAAPGFIERATGVTAAEAPAVEVFLTKLNRTTQATLRNEFPEATAMIVVSLLNQQRSHLKTPWSINAVRGMATMLELDRGILVSNVRRLFLAFDAGELNALFQAYWRITRIAGTRPGVNLLVASEWTPQRSRRLIEAYDTLRLANVDLPEGMDDLAILGLLRLMDDRPATWPQELKRITPVKSRLTHLQRLAQGSVLPPVPAPLQEVVRRLSADLVPGINALHGTPEQVTQAVDLRAKAASGNFLDTGVRSRFVRVVERFQEDLASLQSGNPGMQENAMGGRQELIAGIDVLFSGGEIAQFGMVSKDLQVTVSPGLFDLGRGIHVDNAPREVNLQIDILAKRVTGLGDLLEVIEVTDADMSLPAAWEALDPASGIPPANIDWNDLSPSSNKSHRKWHQVIKLHAAVEFASQLGTHWGSGPVQTPRKVIRARSFTAPAERALRALGFVPETIP